MYISTCQRQLEKHNLTFLTPEEHYDYAISQLNTGYYEEAREQFNAILAAYPEADYALYGLAMLDAITGRAQDCLQKPAPGHRTEPQEPASGPCRQRLPEHGGRSPVYRVVVSRGSLRSQVTPTHTPPLRPEPLPQPSGVREALTAIRPLRVVAIGGGTGLSTLLRGLRRHVTASTQPGCEACLISDLAAVVTVTDDGGSSRPPAQGLQHAASGRPAQLHGGAQRGRGSAGSALRPSLSQRRCPQGAQLRQSLCRRALLRSPATSATPSNWRRRSWPHGAASIR